MDVNMIYIALCSSVLLVSGYYIPYLVNKTWARTISWSIALVATVLSIYSTRDQVPLIRMVIIVSIQLLAMKVIVLEETYKNGNKLSFFQWLAFALGWFGMKPALFETLISKPRSDIFYFLTKGFSRIVIGILLLLLSHHIVIGSLSTLLLLTGLSFTLHFGILNISTGWWRALGVDVKELFISPYKSISLKEFWGKRWNRAFSEMTALIVYKPLLPFLGKQNAMIISFLFSGILHEVAISFPVQCGYGLPLVYFALHAIVMYTESNFFLIKRITSHPVLSHIWVMGWLLLPLPLLFHQAFVSEIVNPLTFFILQTLHISG